MSELVPENALLLDDAETIRILGINTDDLERLAGTEFPAIYIAHKRRFVARDIHAYAATSERPEELR
jgi:hypothetical protein